MIPDSQVPRRRTNAAIAVSIPGSESGIVAQEVLGWPTIPEVNYNGLITTRYLLDFGDHLDNGILSKYPPSINDRPAYTIFVSRVDDDGNEIAGIRLPPVEAPFATTTGWGLRRDEYSENEGLESEEQYIPFKVTKSERVAANDPRLSLEERYGNHDGYIAAVKKAAEKLEKQRFLLTHDVQKYILDAKKSNVLAQ